jgi:hypothetical protein
MKSTTTLSFWKITFIALLLISIRFYPAILEGKVTVFGDNYSLQVPGKIFTAYWLKQGIIPWWNPTIFAGIPWGHEISQSFFYPSTLLFIYLDPGPALNWSIALHLLFTFFGMFVLTKKWVKNDFASLFGAILWTFSTQVTGSSNNLVTIQAIAWFPWLAYWGLRLFESSRNVLIFSLFVLGQFLAGYPQHVVYAIFLAVVLSGIHNWKRLSFLKWLLLWTLTGIITVGITAVAWLPFLEVFLQSTRTIQTTEQAAVGSLHPLMLMKMILPYFFDNPAAGIKWGPAWSGFPNVVFYFTWVGIILLARSLRQKNNISLFIFSFATLIFAMGEHFFLFSFIQEILPFFKVSRGPSIIMVCTNITLAIIAAREFSLTKFNFLRIRKWLLVGIMILIFGLVAYYLTPHYFTTVWQRFDVIMHNHLSDSPYHTIERDFILYKNIVNNILVNIFLFLLFLLFMLRRKIFFGLFIIGIDIIFNTQSMLFFAPADVYPNWSEIESKISLHSSFNVQQFRTLTRNMNAPYTDFGMYWEAMTVRYPFSDSFINSDELRSSKYLKQIRDSYTPDWNMAFQLPVIHGYTTLLPQNFDALWQVGDQAGINAIDQINISNQTLRQWSVANYIVDKQFEIKETLPDSEPIPLSITVDLYKLPALPRFRYEDGSPIDLSTLKENPNLITFTVNNTTHKTLIIADRYDSNWRLTINEAGWMINNHNGMRQFRLNSGINKIRMEYTPTWLYYGFIISNISLLLSTTFLGKKQLINKESNTLR